MKLRENPELDVAIQEARDAVRLLRSVGKGDLAVSIEQILQSIAGERLVIGVIGATKRGKSTLINGMLGRRNDDCAPIARAPATNVISIFGRQESSECKVCFHDREPQTITESEIRLFATEKHNPSNTKKVRSIEVLAPFSGLEQNVFLVDTPGAGNALEEMHGEVLLGFLPNADAVVFMVTAEEPLVESELNLLRAVRSTDVTKLFFAINMVDRVDSGDLGPDALAEGIEHNRNALNSIGLHPRKIYRISAKNYFEHQTDEGTEDLIKDIRQTIATERVTIVIKRLQERTRSVLETCDQTLSQELHEATTSAVELQAQLGSLKEAKKELERGRVGREAGFRRSWSQAFQKLEDDVGGIRGQLLNEYGVMIANTSGLKAGGLSSTIHADVAASFAELLADRVKECEGTITQAQKKLHDQVYNTTIHVAPNLQQLATPISGAKNALEIGLASLPSLITATVAANLPGLLGGIVLSSAPTVATAAWLSPTTWVAAAGTGMANVAVHGIGAAVTTSLTIVAAPLSILAFGISAYRIIDTWRGQQAKHKNELAVSVRALIEDAYHQVRTQLTSYRAADTDLLNAYDLAVEAELVSMEQRLGDLIKNRPNEPTIRALEERHRDVADRRSKLRLVLQEKDFRNDPRSTPLVDALLRNP